MGWGGLGWGVVGCGGVEIKASRNEIDKKERKCAAREIRQKEEKEKVIHFHHLNNIICSNFFPISHMLLPSAP